MRNKISNLAGIALMATMIAAQASSSSVATVPVGMITCALPGGSTSFPEPAADQHGGLYQLGHGGDGQYDHRR